MATARRRPRSSRDLVSATRRTDDCGRGHLTCSRRQRVGVRVAYAHAPSVESGSSLGGLRVNSDQVTLHTCYLGVENLDPAHSTKTAHRCVRALALASRARKPLPSSEVFRLSSKTSEVRHGRPPSRVPSVHSGEPPHLKVAALTARWVVNGV